MKTIKNKKSGAKCQVTDPEWNAMVETGMAKKFNIVEDNPDNKPPRPIPVPDELKSKRNQPSTTSKSTQS